MCSLSSPPVQSSPDFFFLWLFPVVLSMMRGVNLVVHECWSEKPNLGGLAFCESGGGKTPMYKYFEEQLAQLSKMNPEPQHMSCLNIQK